MGLVTLRGSGKDTSTFFFPPPLPLATFSSAGAIAASSSSSSLAFAPRVRPRVWRTGASSSLMTMVWVAAFAAFALPAFVAFTPVVVALALPVFALVPPVFAFVFLTGLLSGKAAALMALYLGWAWT